jgi:hypothetical protein
MRGVVSLLILLAATTVLAQEPQIKKDELYSDVQKRLLAAGWQPARSPGEERCRYHPLCDIDKGEVIQCAGTGTAQCLTRWRKGQTVIEVHTIYDGQPSVDFVRCTAGCKR